MPTITTGTAYRIDGLALGPNDIIPANTSLTEVVFRTEDPDANDFIVTPPSVIFEGTDNEFVLSEAEEISFFADGELIASQSPTYEFVTLNTDIGAVFGITFSAGGDTYFLPSNDSPSEGLTTVTADSQIRANDVSFSLLDFGLTPEGTTEFEGQVFGNGAIDAPGLGSVRTAFDSDDTPFTDGSEVNPFTAEALVTVSFEDGTSIGGVEAYQTGSITTANGQNIDLRAFAVDVAAIEAAGQTLDTIVDAEFESFADIDLTYAEVGFEPVGSTPSIDPVVRLIEGTDGQDNLIGAGGQDVLIGGDGNDRLTGGEDADVFVFGADSVDGNRDRDRILDFNAEEDVIVLEQGASIRSVRDTGETLLITLDGDRDQIALRNFDGDFDDVEIVFEPTSFDFA